MLEVGTKAPDFELFDQDGKLHKLKDYCCAPLSLTYN